MTFTAFLPVEGSPFALSNLFAGDPAGWLDTPSIRLGTPQLRVDTLWRTVQVDGADTVDARVGLRERGDRVVLVLQVSDDVDGDTFAPDRLIARMRDQLQTTLRARIDAAKRRHPSAGWAV